MPHGEGHYPLLDQLGEYLSCSEQPNKEEAMKWMLFVLVFGSHPVETNLLFDSLDACLKAEETMRTEYARAYSQGTWGTTVGEANDPSVVSRFGQRTTATCIPHA
jgi:hypothetical protein